MGKILAIGGLYFFLSWAVPHLQRGEWLTPAPIPPEWWGYTGVLAGGPAPIPLPTADASWGRFDVWNYSH